MAKEVAEKGKKAEKAAKFAEKKLKTAVQAAPSGSSQKTTNEGEKLPEFIEQTPRGEKKILRPLDNDILTKAYIPKVVESAWYDWMRGFTTVWVPGCDHAGISTQAVVENMLWNRRQQTRHDLGRSKFTELVWSWKAEYHEKINRIQRRMGGSMDWSIEAFTMNDSFTAAVRETFCRLHEEGFIYRCDRLVNWCTALNTSLSNLEVDSRELKGRTLLDVPGYDKKIEFGVLTYFKYPVEGSSETIEVATTRPETMLGDTAVAVHPQDERFRHFIGKNVVHPFIPGRLLPIIADEYVDRDFGTGAVKLTPAHDPNDYTLGKSTIWIL
ncbi:MAG: hypothetical protein Q9167_007400 [Letrouitia subvulpina]